MDLKIYYRQIREKLAEIEKEFVVVASKESENGSKEGVLSEVSRDLAAKLIVEGKATLASEAEATRYYAELRSAADKAREQNRISKVQFAVISDSEIDRLKESIKSN